LRVAIFLTGAGCVLAPRALSSADNPPVEEILERARKLEGISDSGTPFLMQATIKAAIGEKEFTGEYKLNWSGPHRWREILVLADFRRIRYGVDDGYRQLRSLEYQPEVIFDLDKMLGVDSMLRIGPRETAREVRTRRIDGVALSCIEIGGKNIVDRELCFDPATGLLVRANLDPQAAPAAADVPIVDYFGTLIFSDKKFPSRVRIRRGRGFSMELAIDKLEPAFIVHAFLRKNLNYHSTMPGY